ncbi:hypothetical protein P5763_07305 [Bacillus cereus]|uniref:hypothetical protein n=1 Tax=Bacillus cereus TaxID=1396 RepID=UPI002406F81F|nr:hypothetical protein [Bacillus cereus]MDF9611879.1 hypothetical protein [Bacillus cereus]
MLKITKEKDDKSFEFSISLGKSNNTPLQNYASYLLLLGALVLWSFTWVSTSLLFLAVAVSCYPTKKTKGES